MARRKKKSRPRRAPEAPAPAGPTGRPDPPATPPTEAKPAPTPIERLTALRRLLAAGETAAALAAVDGWLAELAPPGPEAPDAPEVPDAPGPDEPPPEAAPPVDPVAAGLLQPLDAPGPRFSVLMAAYDRCDLIPEAIESVLVQGFADWELIIVDDGSTDATPEVVQGYAADEPRIRYIRKPVNEGRSPTRSRAVAEARGEFVLWMADDDLLAPDLLATYDRILADEPHVDVIYGKLQLFEGGRDLDVYTPNDWTGRERRLLGAELHGSCIPDGGTATRRALYAKVGAPIYDPEFVRAQDYELWTRLLPHARVRMVDRVVYRYRKHDGGTSWGPFVDLSFDSKIIRRHLSRHPLEALFTTLDWSDAAGARRSAMMRIGRLMLEYHDPHNAERFLRAVAGADVDPEVVGPRVEGRLMAGDLDGAAALFEGFAHRWPGHHPLLERLRAEHRDTVELLRVGRAAIAAGRPSEAEARAVAHHNRYRLGYGVCLLRGLARAAGGDRREGLWFLCQAARLNMHETEAAERAAALAAELGIDGPEADVEAMRGRLAARLYDPLTAPVPETGPTTVSAVILVEATHDLPRALASVRAQRRAPIEILVVDPPAGFDPGDALPVSSDGAPLRAALAAARGEAVAWLTADSAWMPEHITRLAAALDGGAVAAWGDGLRQGGDGETTFAPPAGVSRERLLADDLVPLTALMHRRGAAPEPASGPHRGWIYALDLAWSLDREADLVRVGAPTWVGPTPPETIADAPALERVFTRHPTPLLFAPAARARQAQRLRPLGIDWPLKGRTGVVIVGAENRVALQLTLSAVEAHTRCPHAVVVVADGPRESTRLDLIERCAAHTLVTTPRPLGRAKAVDLGLARAGGDRVALLRAGAAPPDGWLGRMRWWLADDQRPEGLALALPRPPRDPDAPVGRPDDRCLLITRSALDAIGGADVTVEPALWLDDWLLRLRRAGLGWRATDVAVHGPVERFATPAEAPRFVARWGALPMGDRLPDLPADGPAPARCPYGAEEGFRFDIPPVTVGDEGSGPRLLVPDPGTADDPDRRRALWAALDGLPTDLRVWLRVTPGEGPRLRDALAAEAPPERSIWLIDAPLAPDREGGLYTAADAVYVDDGAPDETVRRAFDCGHVPLRDAADLQRWAREVAS